MKRTRRTAEAPRTSDPAATSDPPRRGPGQPPLGDRARSRTIRLRVTAAEEVRLRELAAAAGVSVSELVRRRALGPGEPPA